MTPAVYCTPKVKDATHRKHLKGLVRYGMAALLSPATMSRIERVSIKSQSTSPVDHGECSPDEYDHHNRPIAFSLFLSDGVIEEANLDYMMRVLAHETTHLKQMVLGEYNPELRNNSIMFKGKAYRIKNRRDYLLAPWEVEARGYEDALVQLYKAEKAPELYIP